MSKAAGVHFFEKERILLGKKSYGSLKNKWSGMGGSVERGETMKQAAIREVIEELYGLENISPKTIKEIASAVPLFEVYKTPKYTLFGGDFAALKILNSKVTQLFRSTPHFGQRIPATLPGMVRAFDTSTARNPEIKELKVFGFSEILSDAKSFDPYLIEDIQRLNE